MKVRRTVAEGGERDQDSADWEGGKGVRKMMIGNREE
jgi:hypothetical protein